jgi:hypothetical protein
MDGLALELVQEYTYTMKQNIEHNGFRVFWLVGLEAILTPFILLIGHLTSFYLAFPLVLIPALYIVKILADRDTSQAPDVYSLIHSREDFYKTTPKVFKGPKPLTAASYSTFKKSYAK